MMNRNLMKQAQQLQVRIAKAQEELTNLTVEGPAGGGAIKVVVTGDQRLQSIKIEKDVVSPDDVGMLEDLVLASLNDGLEKSRTLASNHLGKLTGGMGVPGF